MDISDLNDKITEGLKHSYSTDILVPRSSFTDKRGCLLVSDSDFTYIYEVGEIRGTVFQIAARHTPSTNNVESFAVILWFELADGTRVEVAKIDDTEHDEGHIHIDQYYREIGADHRDFTVDVSDCWEAEQHLTEHWQHFGRTYLKNHGRCLREDGVN